MLNVLPTSIDTALNTLTCFCLSGTQSVYVKTWGCSHNNSDSEYMAGQLAAYGYIITGTGNYVMCNVQYAEVY